MQGTIVNTITVILGSSIGLYLGAKLKDSIKNIMVQGVALSTILIGMKMGFKVENFLIVIASIVIGGALGEIWKIEDKIADLGRYIEGKMGGKGGENFVKGFVLASVIFCVGPMTILGCIQDGLNNDPSILYVKSMLDGLTSIMLSSTLGIGVLFSAAIVLLFQGSLTILASFLKFLTEGSILANFTSVGGLIIIAIGIRMLELKEIKVGNFLPALFVVIILDYGVKIVASLIK